MLTAALLASRRDAAYVGVVGHDAAAVAASESSADTAARVSLAARAAAGPTGGNVSLGGWSAMTATTMFGWAADPTALARSVIAAVRSTLVTEISEGVESALAPCWMPERRFSASGSSL